MDEETTKQKSRKELRKEIENAEKKYQGYIERRNEFNDRARQMREERDLLHKKRKEIISGIEEMKAEKNRIFEQLQEHKRRRDMLHKKAHELIDLKRGKRSGKKGESVSTELNELRDRLQKLEYMQETTPMSVDKEREIIDEIHRGYQRLRELEKEYEKEEKITGEMKGLNNELDGLFKEADTEHELVVKYYGMARKIQKKMDEVVKEVSHLIAEADKKHEAYLELRKKADEFHQKALDMRNVLNDIRKENRASFLEIKKRINEQNRAARDAVADEKKLEEKSDEALEQLLKKGKITL